MDVFTLFAKVFKKNPSKIQSSVQTYEIAALSEEGKRDVLKRIKIKGIEKAVHKKFKIISRPINANLVVAEFEGISQKICVFKSSIV